MTKKRKYIGRFAPSPTGYLHFGSLVAALGSYLDAKHHHGQWLVRIEDVDSTRCKKTYHQSIIQTLAEFGLTSDESILTQSDHLDYYQHVLNQLKSHCYTCLCSRKDWQANASMGKIGFIYSKTCIANTINSANSFDSVIRLSLPDTQIDFTDRRLGLKTYHFQQHIGDPILKRRNGDFAYALAVCVDDKRQNITHIVRGQDLLATTPIQLFIQQQLSYPTPSYLHLPLAVDNKGQKLSKQNHAKPITENLTHHAKYQLILDALTLLNQPLPKNQYTQLSDLIQYAITHWRIAL